MADRNNSRNTFSGNKLHQPNQDLQGSTGSGIQSENAFNGEAIENGGRPAARIAEGNETTAKELMRNVASATQSSAQSKKMVGETARVKGRGLAMEIGRAHV